MVDYQVSVSDNEWEGGGAVRIKSAKSDIVKREYKVGLSIGI